eukprot:TRINITY_DN7350_c0_g1_i2.p1 TRINITY_DN7350_c0_g1~~TRINITY_DN7350_c0_g1_i2.p1  ORF type:complete len:525 (+),score=171.24 TRINITY_DN7350_c0_g1_i2:78-1652(+)
MEEPFNDPLSQALSDVSIEPELELSQEEQAYLKKLAIVYSIDKEITFFSQNPSQETIQKTQLLRFIFEEVVADFPLLKKTETTKKAVADAILQYPKIRSLAFKATKKSSTRFPLATSVYELAIRIPSEPSLAELAQSDNIPASRKEMQQNLQMVMNVVRETGVREVFNLFETAKSTRDFPAAYQNLFAVVHKLFVEKMLLEFRDPKTLSKASLLYNLAPIMGIKAVLMIANPLKMLSSMIGLFLARPLGTKNLLQRMFEIIVDLSKTSSLAKEQRKKISDKHLREKISSWTQSKYEPNPSVSMDDDSDHLKLSPAERRKYIGDILKDDSLKPKLDHSLVTNLGADQIEILYRSVQLEMRLKDKTEFIELLGDEQILNLIHDLLPALYHPLMEIYSHADIPKLVGDFFEMAHGIIHAMEAKDTNEDQKRASVVKIVDKFQEDLFKFTQQILTKDEGTIEECVAWAARFFQEDVTMTVDVMEILKGLDESVRYAIAEEVRDWAQLKKRVKAQVAQGILQVEIKLRI